MILDELELEDMDCCLFEVEGYFWIGWDDEEGGGMGIVLRVYVLKWLENRVGGVWFELWRDMRDFELLLLMVLVDEWWWVSIGILLMFFKLLLLLFCGGVRGLGFWGVGMEKLLLLLFVELWLLMGMENVNVDCLRVIFFFCRCLRMFWRFLFLICVLYVLFLSFVILFLSCCCISLLV